MPALPRHQRPGALSFVQRLGLTLPALVQFASATLVQLPVSRPVKCSPHAQPPRTVRLRVGGGAKEEQEVRLDDHGEADIVRSFDLGLPFSDSTAVSVIVDNVLHRVGDLVFFINELHRVIAPAGELIIRQAAAAEYDPRSRRALHSNTIRAFCSSAGAPSPYGLRLLWREAAGTESAEGFELKLEPLAKDQQVPPRLTKLNLGAGNDIRDGFINIDVLPVSGLQVVRDFERYGLPFSESSMEYVYAHHVIEHLDDVGKVMNELWRVCCDDAIIEMTVPNLLDPHLLGDYTHRSFLSARAFCWYMDRRANDHPQPSRVGGSNSLAGKFELIHLRGFDSIHVKLRVNKEQG